MAKDNDKILEQQIGKLGGDKNDEMAALGKLSHIPGTQADLTETEQSSLDKFKAATTHKRETVFSNDIKDGWIPIDRATLGIRSLFYPASWEFRIKPATVEAIKNWSAIDEESIMATNKAMNEVIRTCVSIDTPNGPQRWDKINSWDRLWFILKVREYTFAKGEQALEFDEECDNCGATIHYTLTSNALYYEFPDEDVVDRHWNQDKMVWEINPADYDLENERPIKLYVPTLQKDSAILDWIYIQSEHGKQINETFMKFLPYMLEKAPKDPTLLDKMIKDCYQVFKGWDQDMFLFMDDVRKNITINPSEKLVEKCPGCGEEVKSTVRFPNGIKYLFAVQGRHRKFGTK